MENLFVGLKHLEEEELRFELAMLEIISVSEFANEMKTKAKNAGVRLINSVSELVNSRGMESVKVETVKEKVCLRLEELKEISKEEMIERMKIMLIEKLKGMDAMVTEEMKEEEFTRLVLNEAHMAIPSGIGLLSSPAQKVDDIAEKLQKKQIDDFKTSIGKNKMDRELMAHLVWKIANSYDEPAFPKAFAEETWEQEMEDDYRNSLKDKLEGEKNIKENQQEIIGCENRIVALSETIKDLKEKTLLMENKMEEDRKDLEVAMSADYAGMERVLELTKKESQLKEQELAKWTERKNGFLETAKEQEKKQSDITSRVQKLQEDMAEKITVKWRDKIKNLMVEESAIAHMVTTYSLAERRILESALQELGSAKEPEILAGGSKKNEVYSFPFVLNKKAIGRIQFDRNAEGNIVISEILKMRRL